MRLLSVTFSVLFSGCAWTESWTGCSEHSLLSVLSVRSAVLSVQLVRWGRRSVAMVKEKFYGSIPQGDSHAGNRRFPKLLLVRFAAFVDPVMGTLERSQCIG